LAKKVIPSVRGGNGEKGIADLLTHKRRESGWREKAVRRKSPGGGIPRDV